MKYNHSFLMFCLTAIIVLVSSCIKPDPVSSILPIGSPYEGINGNWRLTKVTQTDEQFKVPPKPTYDLTKFYTGSNPMRIKFDGAARTFAITANGNPNYIGSAGTFTFDDPMYPRYLALKDASGKTDTVELMHAIRPNYNLEYKFSRVIRKVSKMSYTYLFIRE